MAVNASAKNILPGLMSVGQTLTGTGPAEQLPVLLGTEESHASSPTGAPVRTKEDAADYYMNSEPGLVDDMWTVYGDKGSSDGMLNTMHFKR
jgi:hypothetical protein